MDRIAFRASLLLAAAVLVGVQHPLALEGQVSPCRNCLELVPHLELSSADAPVTPSLRQTVLRTADDAYLVSYLFMEPHFAIYDASGSFLEVYDRRGQGPGELSVYPHLFAGPADAIYVWEGAGRLHRFDEALSHISTIRLERRIWNNAAMLPDGSIIVDDRWELPDGRTATVTLLDPPGDVEDVIEAEESEPPGGIRLAPAADGGFWTLPMNANRVRRYGTRGELRHESMIRQGILEPWFERISGEGREVPPRPRHMGLADMGDDALLVLTWVAASDWEPLGPREGMFVPAEEDESEIFDTVIHWVDAVSGEVLADGRSPHALRPVRGAPGLLHGRQMGELGHVTTRVWRVEPPDR